MKNVKKRSLLVVILVILGLSGFMLREGVSHFNAEIDRAIREQERLIDGVTHEIKQASFAPYLFKTRHFVEQNAELRQALAARDRERLYRICLPHYRYLQGENPYFHAMDFNLPDGSVFLRVQKPELFGDNILASRAIVADVHRNKLPRSGFDMGQHGAIFWVAQPILNQGEYLGLVEFGIEVEQLEKGLALILNRDVTSVLKANQWQKAELVQEGFQAYGDYVLMTRGNTLFDQAAGALDFSHLEDQQVTLDGKPHILHSCAVLEDFRKEPLGRLILFQDISAEVARKKTFIRHSLFLTSVVLVAAFIFLFYILDSFIGRLEQYAVENKKAKEDLQLAHDRLEERVKERTVDLAMSNASLEDEIVIRRRAESRLDEQRAFLETILESLTHPFYVLDAETYAIIKANRAARALSNAPPIAGQTCYNLTHRAGHPCSSPEHPCPLAEVKRTGMPTVVEHRHADQDGKERTMEVYAYPILDPQGKVVQVVEYTVDITGRRQTEFKGESYEHNAS